MRSCQHHRGVVGRYPLACPGRNDSGLVRIQRTGTRALEISKCRNGNKGIQNSRAPVFVPARRAHNFDGLSEYSEGQRRLHRGARYVTRRLIREAF